MPNTNERDALIAALNDDTAAAHIYPSTLKTFQRGEHCGECWSIKVGNEDEESIGVFTIEQVFNALAATAPNAGAPLAYNQFVTTYCERSQITREFYDKHFVALPCECDSEGCDGWATIRRETSAILHHLDMRLASEYLAAPAQQAEARPDGFEPAFMNCHLTAAEQHALWKESAPTPDRKHSAGADLTWQLGVFARKLIRAARKAGAPLPLAPSEPDWWHCECDDADYSRLFGHKADALSHLSDHPGKLTALDIRATTQQALPLAPSDAMAEAAIAKRLIELHALMKRTSSMPIMNEWQWLNHLRNTLQARAATPQQATLPASATDCDELLADAKAHGWEQTARVQNAKLMAMTDGEAGFRKLCEVMDRYDVTRAQPQADAAEPVAKGEGA